MSSFKVLHSILRYLLFSIFICIPVNYVAQTNYNAPTNSFSRLLDVVAKVESNNNPKAIGPVTKSGRAKGMYQFTDATAKQFGIDPFDPVQAREGASKYIQQLLKKYDGDLVKALAAYNTRAASARCCKWCLISTTSTAAASVCCSVNTITGCIC